MDRTVTGQMSPANLAPGEGGESARARSPPQNPHGSLRLSASGLADLNLFDQTHPSFGPSAPNQRSVITFFRV